MFRPLGSKFVGFIVLQKGDVRPAQLHADLYLHNSHISSTIFSTMHVHKYLLWDETQISPVLDSQVWTFKPFQVVDLNKKIIKRTTVISGNGMTIDLTDLKVVNQFGLWCLSCICCSFSLVSVG